MCLAVPGRVLEISERDGTRIAQVDFGGVSKEVCLEYVPDLQVGEYTIVHVGFALQRLDEQSALETLDLFRQMGELEAEFGDQWGRAAEQAGLPRPDLAQSMETVDSPARPGGEAGPR
jgi:hydrogenase expression/formation protein HypC